MHDKGEEFCVHWLLTWVLPIAIIADIPVLMGMDKDIVAFWFCIHSAQFNIFGDLMHHYSDKVRFQPWIGTNYGSSSIWGIPFLILGESHYDRNGVLGNTDATQQIIEGYINGWSHQYYTKIMNAVMGLTGSSDNRTRSTCWQSVAFYNYVQTVVGTEPGQRPTEKMWDNSQVPFKEILATIKPRCILVIGKDLWSHLIINTSGCKNIDVSDKIMQAGIIDSALAGVVKHVSQGFSPLDWHPLIKQLINNAKD